MIQKNLINHIQEMLKKFDQKYLTDEGDFILSKIRVDIENFDESLISALMTDELISQSLTKKIGDMTVFDVKKLTELLNYESYWQGSYTKYANKIGLTVGGKYLDENLDVVLDFPYKDTVLTANMSKESEKLKELRDEPFLNEVIAKSEIDVLLDKKILINAVKYDSEHLEGEKVTKFDEETDNLIIKGNNLLALHSLKEKYAGKVKLIYLDPPYYFDKDKSEDTFQYNSNFKLSTWLTFMKNRLEVAKELLSNDGSLFIQISDDGVAELHILLKEIFGRENFINKITVKTKSPSGFASVNPGVFETAEYIIGFAKNKNEWLYNTQYVVSNYDTNYKWYIVNKETSYENWIFENVFDTVAKKNGYVDKNEAKKAMGQAGLEAKVSDFVLENHDKVFRTTAISNKAGQAVKEIRDISKLSENTGKIFEVKRDENYDVLIKNGEEISFYSKKVKKIEGNLKHSIQASNIWTDTPYEGISKEGNVTLKGGKKPEKLVKRIIELASNKNDIVLDFFAGSGTTAAVSHKLGRKYITIEQIDYGNDSVWERLKNVIKGDKSGISKGKDVNWKGGGSFVYAELMEKNTGFIREIADATTIPQLQAIFNRMKARGDIDFRVDDKLLSENLSTWEDNLGNKLEFEEIQKLLIRVIDKNQLYYNLSEMDDEKVKDLLEVQDVEFNKDFYGE